MWLLKKTPDQVILPVHKTYEDRTECPETSGNKILAPRNPPKDRTQDKQCAYNLTSRPRRLTTVALGKQRILHKLSVCLWPQIPSMQCSCAILSSVAYPALHYYSILSHKRHDSGKKKKVIGNDMCVWSFSTTSVWNISHSKKKWARYDQKCTLVFM